MGRVMPSTTYRAVHYRLSVQRGNPKDYRCVDCGLMARTWAYDHADPNELREIKDGHETRYSLDLFRYEPRCSPCHGKFDARHSIRQGRCRSGRHDLTETAIFRSDGGRQCAACKREREASAEYRARAQERGEAKRRAAGVPVAQGKRTHCPHGHPYAGANLRVRPTGVRECVTCVNATQRARRAAKSKGT